MARVSMREYRITSKAFAALGEGKAIPKRGLLLKYLSGRDAEGRSVSDFTAFRNRGPVTRDFAEGFIDYARNGWKQAPDELHALLHCEDRFDMLFEKVPASEIPKPYLQPSESNDPTVKGLRSGVFAKAVQGAIQHILFGPKSVRYSNRRHLAVPNGFDDYERIVYIEIGKSQAKPKENLGLDDAYQRGIEYIREPPGFFRDRAATLTSINPDCIHYALDKSGNRIGISAAHAVSDDGFDAMLRGECRLSEFPNDYLEPCGNNIVLEMLAEIHDSQTSLSIATKRARMVSAVAYQIALLIDPDNPRPLRFASAMVIESNTRRLKGFGFRPIQKCPPYRRHPGGPTFTMVEFDPTNRDKATQCVMYAINKLVRHIRLAHDGKPIEA